MRSINDLAVFDAPLFELETCCDISIILERMQLPRRTHLMIILDFHDAMLQTYKEVLNKQSALLKNFLASHLQPIIVFDTKSIKCNVKRKFIMLHLHLFTSFVITTISAQTAGICQS